MVSDSRISAESRFRLSTVHLLRSSTMELVKLDTRKLEGAVSHDELSMTRGAPYAARVVESRDRPPAACTKLFGNFRYN